MVNPLVFFRYDDVKKNLSKTFLKAQQDIGDAQSKAERDRTIADLNRCGELSFMTPTGEKIVCPVKAGDVNGGENRLAWLKSQLSTYLPHDEKLTAILKYVEENAHQNGFLFAGRNGLDEIMAEKHITRNNGVANNEFELQTQFGVTSNGTLSYIETCHLPRDLVQANPDTGDMSFLSASNSVGSVTARSTISADSSGKIEHTLDKVDVKIKDKIGLKIFQDTPVTSAPTSEIAPTQASASDDRSVLKRISDFVSRTFKSLTDSVNARLGSRSPRP